MCMLGLVRNSGKCGRILEAIVEQKEVVTGLEKEMDRRSGNTMDASAANKAMSQLWRTWPFKLTRRESRSSPRRIPNAEDPIQD